MLISVHPRSAKKVDVLVITKTSIIILPYSITIVPIRYLAILELDRNYEF